MDARILCVAVFTLPCWTAPDAPNRFKFTNDTVLAVPQKRLHAWTAAEFPTPGEDSEVCFPRLPSFFRAKRFHGRGPWVCDPGSLLNASVDGSRELELFNDFLVSFGEQFSPQLYSDHWGIYLSVAIVSETAETLSEFALALAKRWAGAVRSLLIVVSADGPPGIELAGTLKNRLRSEALSQILQMAQSRLDQGAIASSVELVVREVIRTVESTYVRDSANSGMKFKDKAQWFASWTSMYQNISLRECNCGERRCLELALNDCVQLSDRYSDYYHEALVYPVLNSLGPDLAKRVLILGGGDGGVATHVLKYKSVERVVAVEIDEEVVNISKLWFPALANGYDDPRCELVITDALAWVKNMALAKELVFDAVIIDFTDEPVAGAWNPEFYQSLKALLGPHGVLVQNLGGDYAKILRCHLQVFEQVSPIQVHCPDYEGLYTLVLSTDFTDVRRVYLDFWEEQKIIPKYYTPALHPHIFWSDAGFHKAIGLPVPARPEIQNVTMDKNWKSPTFSTLNTHGGPDEDKIQKKAGIRKRTSRHNDIRLFIANKSCEEDKPIEKCSSLAINGEFVAGATASGPCESMVYPAMNILGSRAEHILILGGGSGNILWHVLQFPPVKKVTVVEIDKEVIKMVVDYGSFPGIARALNDSRVEAVIENAYTWVRPGGASRENQYDAIFLSISDELWRKASTVSRVPRIMTFYTRLHALLKQHGLLLQQIGSLSSLRDAQQLVNLHRAAAFSSTWVLHFARIPDIFAESYMKVEDGYIRRPPRFHALSSKGPLHDPLDVDWVAWEKLGLETWSYHASMHHALFVLPAELQRHFDIPPPQANMSSVYISS